MRPFAPSFEASPAGLHLYLLNHLPVPTKYPVSPRLTANSLTLEPIQELILLMRTTIAKTLHSGGLAKATGVSPDTIRHYEKIGVLPRVSRTESGYRLYPESAVERVLVVQRALRIGFTLAELAEVLKARDTGGAPCQRVYKLAKEKLKGIRGDIKALKRTERYLTLVLSDWEDRIRRGSPGTNSNLLHSLTGAISDSGRTMNQFRRRRT
jgi:DNA-binding transcriptional MerR regulator